MRILLAATFSFAAMLASVGMLHAYAPAAMSAWWLRIVPGTVLLLALFLSLIIFNKTGFRPNLLRKSLAERLNELEASGELLRQSFDAKRAFGVNEFEDEGPHYYVELVDNTVLYLNGQYLYDYEPIDDDPEFNQSRTFPCTAFEVLRHKTAGYVIHINCNGQVLQPEIMAPPFSKDTLRAGIPEDGQVLDSGMYDALKDRYATA